MSKETMMEYIDKCIETWKNYLQACSMNPYLVKGNASWANDIRISIWTLENFKKTLEADWEKIG